MTWVISRKGIDVKRAKEVFDKGRIKFFLANPITKHFFSSLLKKGKTGKTRFEEELEKYVKKGRISGMNLPLNIFLKIIKNAFNRDEKEFIESLNSDNTLKKLMKLIMGSVVRYGVTFPQKFISPPMVVWNITYKCNLRCKHCYEDAGLLRHGSADELTYEEKIDVLKKLNKANIPSIFFSGGEPLMAPRFWDIAKKAKEMGFYLSIASNGTLFNKENARRAKKLGFGYIAISVDSPDPKKHDEFRGIKGSWERAVTGIKNLVKAGVTTCIQYTFSKENADDFKGMLKLRKKLGAYKLIVYNYIPVGRGGFDNDPTPEQREWMYEGAVKDILESKFLPVASTAPQLGRYCKQVDAGVIPFSHYGSSAKMKELSVIADIVGGCGAGRAYCALQPNGDITPCVYMPDVKIGNLKKQSFSKIWNHPLMNWLRDTTKNVKGNCATCPFKEMCGGCRARALAYFASKETHLAMKRKKYFDELTPKQKKEVFKTIMMPDPGCIYNKDDYYRLQKELVG